MSPNKQWYYLLFVLRSRQIQYRYDLQNMELLQFRQLLFLLYSKLLYFLKYGSSWIASKVCLVLKLKYVDKQELK